MKHAFLLVFLLIMFSLVNGQEGKDGHTVFYHPNGKVSSEGTMRNGRPDGYWKTYNEQGVLVSEGMRREFLLDSTWTFYSDSGNIVMTIDYRLGMKSGPRVTYRGDERIIEPFADDIKQGTAYYYRSDTVLYRTVPFVNGLEEGLAKDYAEDGQVIMLTEYKRGYIVRRENINRFDRNGLKQGMWKIFHANGVVKLEGTYTNDLRNGYFKEYDQQGKLIAVSKYLQGILQEDAQEVSRLEMKVDYYPDGKPRIVGQYFNGIPEGVRREYNENGELVRGFVFRQGIITGRGITTEKGLRDGPWIEYYEDGKLYAEGTYKSGLRIGKWKFYYRSGKLEQEGVFNNRGRYDGTWRWYYEGGNLLREEEYLDGERDGMLTEYSDSGMVVVQGEFVDGLEEGPWKFDMGDHLQAGNYAGGLRQGEWKYYFRNGNLSYNGSFVEDNPNGRHTWYWENGRKKDEGFYVMGRREGEWVKYDDSGLPYLYISYKDGVEKRYDGVRIEPEIPDEQPIED